MDDGIRLSANPGNFRIFIRDKSVKLGLRCSVARLLTSLYDGTRCAEHHRQWLARAVWSTAAERGAIGAAEAPGNIGVDKLSKIRGAGAGPGDCNANPKL